MKKPTHGRFKSLEGCRFGRLIVLSYFGKKKSNHTWLCLCDCTKKKIVFGSNLKGGQTKSCGCLHSEIVSEMNYKHGKRDTKEYRSWYAMLHRCKNPRNIAYKYYGGRGISVCDRWERFESFLEDMGQCPENKTLDRIQQPSKAETGDRIDSLNLMANHFVWQIGLKPLGSLLMLLKVG